MLFKTNALNAKPDKDMNTKFLKINYARVLITFCVNNMKG